MWDYTFAYLLDDAQLSRTLLKKIANSLYVPSHASIYRWNDN